MEDYRAASDYNEDDWNLFDNDEPYTLKVAISLYGNYWNEFSRQL